MIEKHTVKASYVKESHGKDAVREGTNKQVITCERTTFTIKPSKEKYYGEPLAKQ